MLRCDAPPEQRAEQIARVFTAYTDALVAAAAEGEQEVRARAIDVLFRAALEARIGRTLLKFHPASAKTLRAFRKAHPDLLEGVFGRNTDRRVLALRRIAALEDPEGLAEPLLVLCLNHPAPEMRSLAARAAASEQYGSEALVESLGEMLIEEYLSHRTHADLATLDGETPADPFDLALRALEKHPGPASAGPLAGLVLAQRWGGDEKAVQAAQVLAKTKAYGVIPAMRKSLGAWRKKGSSGFNGVRVTHAASDLPLYVLVVLTGQNPGSYGFIIHQSEHHAAIGFADQDKRMAALKKWKAWWKAHEDEPPYKDLKPIEVPDVRRRHQPRRPRKAASPAGTPKKTPPTTQPTRTAERLAEAMAEAVGEVTPGLASRRFMDRRRAQKKLEAVYRSAVESLTGAPEAAATRTIAADALSRAVAEARVARLLASQDAEGLRTLRALRETHPGLLRDLHSLSWSRAARRLLELPESKVDAEHAAPLLLSGMDHPSAHVQAAAVSDCGQMKLDRPKVVDRLLGFAREGLKRGHWFHWDRHTPRPDLRAIEALEEIAPPSAAPLALAVLTAENIHSTRIRAAGAELLVAAGSKGAVPALAEDLAYRKANFTWSSGDRKLTIAYCDASLQALVLLTGQKLQEYDFVAWPHHGEHEVQLRGFPDEKTRKAAIKKFQTWWKKHKDRKPWKNLKPIEPEAFED